MIEEEGVVIGFRNGKALVMTERTSACEGCASLNICETVAGGKEMVVEAENPFMAEKGDKVLINLQGKGLLGLSFVTYVVPMIAFLSGILFGMVAGKYIFKEFDKDLLSAGGGFIFLALSFIMLRWWGRRVEGNKNFIPVIVRKIGQTK